MCKSVILCVSQYIKKHSVSNRCYSHRRSGGGKLCVCVCVLRQLAEEAGHVLDHMRHGGQLG